MTTKTFEMDQALAAAESYERTFVPAIGRPVAERLLVAAKLRPNERVLDVGCGTGIVARLARERVGPGGAVTGVDVNPAMLAVAREVSPEAPGMVWRQAPAESLPLGDGGHDVVLCQMALQFFQDRAAALREMHRVLARDGRLLLALPGPATPLFDVLETALGRHLGPPAAGFVRLVFSLHEPEQVEDLLRQGGFGSVEIRPERVRLDLPGPADFLEQYVASTPLSASWAKAEGPARAAARREVLDGWLPFTNEGKLMCEQSVVVALARA